VDVYHQLREAIVDGTFSADTPLTETTLAAQFSVSRTPIREALRRLEQDGLVERGPRGMQVRGRSPEEILEIYEVRLEYHRVFDGGEEVTGGKGDVDAALLGLTVTF